MQLYNHLATRVGGQSTFNPVEHNNKVAALEAKELAFEMEMEKQEAAFDYQQY